MKHFELQSFDFNNRVKRFDENGECIISWPPESGQGGIVICGKTLDDAEKKFKEASIIFTIVKNIINCRVV